MIYPIYVYGSAVLRKESVDIMPDYPGLDSLVESMYETMYESEGVGLAAPQIGKNIRLFVVDLSPFEEKDPVLAEFKKTFINAQIYERTGDHELFEEGCLSVPGIREEVSRPSVIKMRWVDENFVAHDQQFDGIVARVIQHEYDHIDAKLFVDHLSPLRKTLLKSKLIAMSKGKYSADYKTKLIK